MAAMEMEEMLKVIQHETAEFSKYFGQLDEQKLNKKMHDDDWSIAQCIQHIILYNEAFLLQIQTSIKDQHQFKWFEKWNVLLDFYSARALKNIESGQEKIFEQQKQLSLDQDKPITGIVAKFLAHQQQLQQRLINAAEAINQNFVVRSSYEKTTVYRIRDAFQLITAHEQQHLKQAKNILAAQYAEKMVL